MDDTPQPSRKILVALDGSRHSHNTLHYLAGLFADQADVGLHLLSLVTGASLPPGSEWLSEAEQANMMSPQTRKKLVAHQGFLHEAADFLTAQGVAPERVAREVGISSGSVSRDIANRARQGRYDAVAVGRRGMTKLEEMLLGSVSNDIFEYSHDIPLWVVDGRIDNQRFLVPVDKTPYALLAVDHLAFMLRGHPRAEITLFHSTAILAAPPRPAPEEFRRHWDPAWCEQHLDRPDSLFHAPRQILLDAGFPGERVSELETAKGFEPSRQIIRQALMDDYGTIVMGRRGPEAHKGIFRGVSDRVLLMAEQVAVWIVG
ncbi:MAG TPA: universal stress protein [Desulfurivibrio alkaliphilus]|uniref:Universal stress protein n=1 Tax=Desulfurivibrio alkaliphilus TaxID=427923 RepID=A0A7C2TH49_9BACT|nr:universal stress protein [Desulfurivibrio alkaliphilus]